jgi:hypothetical protein
MFQSQLGYGLCDAFSVDFLSPSGGDCGESTLIVHSEPLPNHHLYNNFSHLVRHYITHVVKLRCFPIKIMYVCLVSPCVLHAYDLYMTVNVKNKQ